MSGSVCVDVAARAERDAVTDSIPSRISSVSPGSPTSRFTKFFVGSSRPLEDDDVAALRTAIAGSRLLA